MQLHKLLMQDSYWMLNKQIARATSVEASLLLAELLYKYDFFAKKGELTTIEGEEYFYVLAEEIQEQTTLSKYNQTEAIRILTQVGILKVKKKGAPAKRYFHINESVLLKILLGEDKYIEKLEELKTKEASIKVKLPKEAKEFPQEVEDLAKVYEEDLKSFQNTHGITFFSEITDKHRFAWKDTFDKLIRNDNKQVGEIHNLIRWIRKDYDPHGERWKGWCMQVRSATKLRELDKQGVMYYNKILSLSKGRPSKSNGHILTPEQIKILNGER